MKMAEAKDSGRAGDEGGREDDRLEFADAAGAEIRHLYWLAYSILGNGAEAEDAVQETLMRAWRDRSRLRHGAALPAWMTTTCTRYCIRRRRVLALWRPLRDRSQEASLPASSTAALLDLDRASRRLTPSQRAVLTLHYHLGMSLDECAAVMGRRPGTVRSHLARALDTLRREMADG